MSEYEEILLKAAQELLKEGKISKLGDIYSGKSKEQKKQPPQQPPQQPPVSVNQTLSKDLIDIIIENGNCIGLGVFLGLTPPEAINILYNKTTYKTANLPPGVVARVDQNNNMEINIHDFNYILKYHNSPSKPFEYWSMIYVLTHEIIHIFIRPRDGKLMGYTLDEAIVPIIEYEFYVNHNGANSPHLIDASEKGFIRMHNKKSPYSRAPYLPETFYYFDQLVGFDSLYPDLFIKLLHDYTKANPTSPDKLAVIKKYYKLFEEQ